MDKLPYPKEIVRTTLDDNNIPDIPGIYIIAYLKTIVYVGKSESDVRHRIATHRWMATTDTLGSWMVRCEDWPNIRVDVLIPPATDNWKYWIAEAESACIRKFKPILNRNMHL